MVSGTRAPHTIAVTAESLHKDLARLELQKQALERELAAVVAHLGSVQRALSAIEALMRDTTAAAPANAQAQADLPAAEDAVHSEASASADTDADADADRQRKYGQLTEQILEYFATVGQADVRARDVAAALGRDTDSGSINAVRSTLDRLVGTSRIRRTGRGLYRAKRS
ncbi:hypothetical protein [Streptomyces sp. NPDC059861]|uniref:hypothetical protein n=1 Tax=Streptomyces sp. NPDC059861 TaxID=3346974 RepID=UPI00364B52D7